MMVKLLIMILRNMVRSRTRLAITTLGCAVAAFVACFFFSAQDSLIRMTDSASQDANIVVRQKDRY